MRRTLLWEEQADEALPQLGFLLIIIILNGHDWSLVIATRREHKTILGTQLPFGSTRDAMHMYQTIAGLREAASWARDIYLP
jgi:hypothetical protein